MQITDQLGRIILLDAPPQRIVSLVPSQTELLHTLGLNNRVVGVTKFCVHPPQWRKEKKMVGGTKILNFKTIDALQPDLIIANKEENNAQDIARLEEKYPVWVSDVNDFDGAIKLILDVGVLTETVDAAVKIATKIHHEFESLQWAKNKKTLYLIWRKPFMAAAGGTFISDMMAKCGFENVLDLGRYPQLTENDFLELQPELVLFSSEPYPFKEHHTTRIAKILPHAKMQLVDGEAFSWYGSRMLHSVAYFNKLLKVLEEEK